MQPLQSPIGSHVGGTSHAYQKDAIANRSRLSSIASGTSSHNRLGTPKGGRAAGPLASTSASTHSRPRGPRSWAEGPSLRSPVYSMLRSPLRHSQAVSEVSEEKKYRVPLKQRDLRLLRKMVVDGLGEGEVPPYDPQVPLGLYASAPIHFVIVVFLFLAPLFFVSSGGVIYAAFAPALAFFVYLIPAVRTELNQREHERTVEEHHKNLRSRAASVNSSSMPGGQGVGSPFLSSPIYHPNQPLSSPIQNQSLSSATRPLSSPTHLPKQPLSSPVHTLPTPPSPGGHDITPAHSLPTPIPASSPVRLASHTPSPGHVLPSPGHDLSSPAGQEPPSQVSRLVSSGQPKPIKLFRSLS